jgi:rhodanese-related sulfurtransferase
VIDIRAAADFARGHIEGAVNVPLANIATYMKSITASNFDKIAVVCYSGQTAGYAVSLVRLLGYSNVFDLKFGMSAWNDSVENKWKPAIANNYAGFVTTAAAKNAKGNLPTLSTGKTTGAEILEARVNQLLAAADPFGDIKVTWNTVTGTPSNYYIINYWTKAHYDLGHIPGAIQYTPLSDLRLDSNLTTLPTNKTIALYCYTGQTSAQVVTYLKLLGYDAKSVLFGVSTMNYDLLLNNNLSTFKASECKYYPYVK